MINVDRARARGQEIEEQTLLTAASRRNLCMGASLVALTDYIPGRTTLSSWSRHASEIGHNPSVAGLQGDA